MQNTPSDMCDVTKKAEFALSLEPQEICRHEAAHAVAIFAFDLRLDSLRIGGGLDDVRERNQVDVHAQLEWIGYTEGDITTAWIHSVLAVVPHAVFDDPLHHLDLRIFESGVDTLHEHKSSISRDVVLSAAIRAAKSIYARNVVLATYLEHDMMRRFGRSYTARELANINKRARHLVNKATASERFAYQSLGK